MARALISLRLLGLCSPVKPLMYLVKKIKYALYDLGGGISALVNLGPITRLIKKQNSVIERGIRAYG